MSYILEALEKSEKERKEKTVPDLQTQHTVYPGMTRSRRNSFKSPSRLRPAVIFAIALIPCVWILRDHLPMEMEIRLSRQQPQSVELQKPAHQPSQEAEIASLQLQQETQPQPAVKKELVTSESSPALEHGGEVAIQPPGENIGEKSEENEWEVIEPRQRETATPVEETVVQREDIRLQPAPILLDREIGTDNALIPIPYLDELPTSLQNQIPKLRFAGHTYSQEAAQRLIIINNSINREGDLVEPGLHLKEITWEGVILEYQGTSFQVRTTGT